MTLAAVLVLLVGPPLAAGAELSRQDYVSRAESICKKAVDASTPSLVVATRKLKEGQIKIAGREYRHAAKVVLQSGRHIETVPKPAADAKTLTEWLRQDEAEDKLLSETGAELIAGRRERARGLLARFIHAGKLANEVVFGFGFDYCLFKPSRLTAGSSSGT